MGLQKMTKIMNKVYHDFVFVHQISSDVYSICKNKKVCDKVLEVANDVFIKVCGNTGRAWVASEGNSRMMLMHVKAFEESIRKNKDVIYIKHKSR